MSKNIRYITAFILLSFYSVSSQQKVLFVTSNQNTYGNTQKATSNHFGEIVMAYDVFISHGYEIDFTSPNGGEIPLGYIKTKDPIHKKYLNDILFLKKVKETLRPKDVVAKDYIAVYYSGGGAAMFGVPENEEIQRISKTIYSNQGILSAVCHGTAGIVHIKNEKGEALYTGKKISGFPDMFENKEREYYKTFPFSIEKEVEKNGAKFRYSKKGWDNFFVVDGRIVTGQDPSSSSSVAQKVIEILKSK